MSFFYDFLESFNIDSMTDKVAISLILGVGVVVVGKIKILHLSEDIIEIKVSKNKVVISGSLLKIKTMSKGEIVVSGNVNKIESGEL